MNDSQGDAWTYAEAVEWWQDITSYQGWVSCILYDPNELQSMVAAMIAEVERLRDELAETKAEFNGLSESHDRLGAELAAAKASSVLPVGITDLELSTGGQRIEFYIEGDKADGAKMLAWLRDRMKGGEG